MEIKLFVFSIEAFQFYKFHETETKKDKYNFKKDLIGTFEAENSLNYGKN